MIKSSRSLTDEMESAERSESYVSDYRSGGIGLIELIRHQGPGSLKGAHSVIQGEAD